MLALLSDRTIRMATTCTRSWKPEDHERDHDQHVPQRKGDSEDAKRPYNLNDSVLDAVRVRALWDRKFEVNHCAAVRQAGWSLRIHVLVWAGCDARVHDQCASKEQVGER